MVTVKLCFEMFRLLQDNYFCHFEADNKNSVLDMEPLSLLKIELTKSRNGLPNFGQEYGKIKLILEYVKDRPNRISNTVPYNSVPYYVDKVVYQENKIFITWGYREGTYGRAELISKKDLYKYKK